MNLHEIEETLHILKSRHSDLDEQMLVTLLRGGGWEEKHIQDALFLFRSKGVTPNAGSPPELPPVQSEPVFEPQVDGNHLLVGQTELPVPEKGEEAVPVVESLVTSAPEHVLSKDELPHNLPLRPFETSDHVWPFSRYRDVFYGEQELKVEEPEPVQEQKQPVPLETKKEENVPVQPKPVASEPEVELIPVPLSKGDEGLVFLACIMLIAVLFLLGYMYSNGRL